MTLGPARPSAIAALRNVVLLGPTGSGKTTLAEQLIAISGAVPTPGSVDGADSILDADPAARRQRRSVELAVASLQFHDTLITLIDTPGYVDFLGEVRAGLRAADAALFVISALDGIDPATRALWDECEAMQMPRGVVITNLDDDDADFDETVAICHRMFTGGREVLPLHLPVLDDEGSFIGVLDLITNRIHEWSSAQRQERLAEPQHLDMTSTARAELVEGIAAESDDEQLMDLLLDGHDIDPDVLTNDLVRAINRGHFYPALAFSGENGFGGELILDLIARAFPSPLERAMPLITTAHGHAITPLLPDLDGPLCAEVIKTTTDQTLGRHSIVRVFSGRLPRESPLHIAGHFSNRPDRHDHDLTERDGALSLCIGSIRLPIESAIAGSIVAVTQLHRAETGDTISDVSNALLVEPWLMPEANLPIAITAADPADEQRLATALERLIAEDPSLKVSITEGQLTLWCLGESHAELAVARLHERFGVEIVAEELRISLRESFSSSTSGSGVVTDDKGAVLASCSIDIEALPSGAGIEVLNAIPDTPLVLAAAVERGVRQQLTRGGLAGYPTTDVRVRITAVAAPDGESSEPSLEAAGASAVLDAETKADKHLLEPHETVIVITPEEFADAITNDLKGKRGSIADRQINADGTVTLTATAPAAELFRFAIDIRSLSHGAGSFERQSAGFARVPRSTGLRLLPMID